MAAAVDTEVRAIDAL